MGKAGYDQPMPNHYGPNDAPPTAARPRTVLCAKLQQELPGLPSPPWPGELGARIYEQISAQAWKQWEERQKMILNEYRLLPWQKEAQDVIARHMEEFLFGTGTSLPPDFVPEPPK